MSLSTFRQAVMNTTVMVSALGYFVDIYDLVLFSIVRVSSLKSLGVADDKLLEVGIYLINMQMTGMLIGGIIWGVLGDKRGRVSVLFGSIVLYSLANIANAFVTSTDMYGVMRLLAGIGLAGELGAAVTLVSEYLPKETRGYGTSFVAAIGVSGAMLAAFVGKNFDWKIAYVVGGAMGLMLLVLRVRMLESGMFNAVKQKACKRGDLVLLLSSPARLFRYVCCILIGVPLWFVIGILVTFSPEIGKELGATGPVSAADGILYAYLGLVFGDFGSGFISQWAKNRKKVIFGFVLATMALIVVYCNSHGMAPEYYYGLCFALGCASGYWALFVTVAAEQFGTNLRATVAITTPNFVRGSVVLLTMLLKAMKDSYGLTGSALYIGTGCVIVSLAALTGLRECFGRDLDYIEAAVAEIA